MRRVCESQIRAVALACAIVGGCVDAKPESDSAVNAGPLAISDSWLGTWKGPEGTSLELVGGGGMYDVTIRNLDGARAFRGRADGGGVTFERDGKRESIRPTDGAGTGMKWLRAEPNCLTVRVGEGYCRGR